MVVDTACRVYQKNCLRVDEIESRAVFVERQGVKRRALGAARIARDPAVQVEQHRLTRVVVEARPVRQGRVVRVAGVREACPGRHHLVRQWREVSASAE